MILVGGSSTVISTPPTVTVTGKAVAPGGSLVEVVVTGGDSVVEVVGSALDPHAVTKREIVTSHVSGFPVIRRFIQYLLSREVRHLAVRYASPCSEGG
jgi:hypothetical protein